MFATRSSRSRITPGTPPIPAPTVTGNYDRSVQAGATLVATLEATVYNDGGAIWSVDSAPAAMTSSVDGNAITLTWITDDDDLRDDPYTVALSVSDGVRFTSVSFHIEVKAAAGALLTMVEAGVPAAVDLSAVTHADWAYYGVNAATDEARKDIETPIIGTMVWNLEAVPGRGVYTNRPPFAWDDGAEPFAIGVDVQSGPHKRAVGVAGHGFTVPIAAADDEIREAWLFFGGLTTNASETTATLVELSLALDGAAPIAQTYAFGPNKGLKDRLFRVQFRAASGAVDPELSVSWTNKSTAGGVQCRAILVDADIAGLSLSAPVAVNVYELYTGTLTYDGESTASLIAYDLPAGARFIDNGNNTGTLTYRPPVGADTQSPNAIVFEAVVAGVVVATYEAGVSVSEATAEPPVITVETPWVVTIDASDTQTVTAAGESGIMLDIVNPPDDVTFVPSTGVLSWAPTSADLAGSPYTLTITATDGDGRQSTATIIAEVVTGAGSLSIGSPTVVDPAVSPFTPNLSTAGSTGWAHITRNGGGLLFNRKATGPVIAASVATLTNWTVNTNTQVPACTWTGGTPTASQTAYVSGLRTTVLNEELTFTIPVGIGAKSVVLYTGHAQATYSISASISDGGSVPRALSIGATTDATRQVSTPISLTGIAADAVLTLTVRKTSAGGWCTITALTVA